MADLVSPGSVGLGAFRVAPEGEVYFDPQGGDWPEGVTETRLPVLVRDATGALVLAEVTVDVTGPASGPTYATDGMTASATWSVVGAYYYDMADAVEASARVTGSRVEGDEGILHEAGSYGHGILLYIHNENLYFRCGNGSGKHPFGEPDVGYIIVEAPTGDFVIEWSASVLTGKAALYINGVLVGSATFSNPVLANSDEGSIGVAGYRTAANFGLWGIDSGAFEGTVSEAIVYVDQITSEVET